MAAAGVARLSRAAALLVDRCARTKFSRAPQMVGGAKQSAPPTGRWARLDQSNRPDATRRLPGAKRPEMAAGRNRRPDPPHAEAIGGERPYPLEPAQPDAQRKFERDAPTRALSAACADASAPMARLEP